MTDKIMPPDADQLWNVRDVARYLRASRSWVYKAAERNTIPAVRVGSLLRFDPSAIRAYVAALAPRDRQ